MVGLAIRFHDLRHTLAVRLLQKGWDIPTVGALLGHRPPYRATARYVAHTSSARMRDAMESLQKPNPQQFAQPRKTRRNQST